MAEWRFGRGWSDRELEERLLQLKRVPLNFPTEGPESQAGKNWRRYYSESVIAREAAGEPQPGGPFELAWKAVAEYQFSDPEIVTAHFHANDALQGRTMLLEIKVLGLRYLCGTRVTRVRDRREGTRVTREFLYETLQGHFEVGSEWFSLSKDTATGEVWFRISASWRPGNFPNWWSRLGFEALGRKYQLAWHRLAYVRLRALVSHGGADLLPIPYGERLVHTGPEINDSEIWILQEPDVGTRIDRAATESELWPRYEEDKSSLLQEPRPASGAQPPSRSRGPGQA